MLLIAKAGQSASEAAGDLSTGEAALWAAAIAATAAILTSAINALIQHTLASRAEKSADTQTKAERVTEQLSKLYGPLRLLTEQSKALAEKLREGKPDPESWNLLHNLAEVIANDADRALAQQIIDVNGRIEELLLKHAGLLKDGEVPPSFVDFLGHYRSLVTAFDAAKAQKAVPKDFTAKQFETYPREFDTAVRSSYDTLLAKRKHLQPTEDRPS